MDYDRLISLIQQVGGLDEASKTNKEHIQQLYERYSQLIRDMETDRQSLEARIASLERIGTMYKAIGWLLALIASVSAWVISNKTALGEILGWHTK